MKSRVLTYSGAPAESDVFTDVSVCSNYGTALYVALLYDRRMYCRRDMSSRRSIFGCWQNNHLPSLLDMYENGVDYTKFLRIVNG